MAKRQESPRPRWCWITGMRIRKLRRRKLPSADHGRHTITTSYVYNIKNKGNKRRRTVKAVVAKSGVGIPEVKAALALLKACKNESAVKEALAAAKEIKAMV